MKQRIRYVWHIIVKLFSFAFFGSCSLLLALILFPIMHIMAGFSEKKVKFLARKFNDFYFKLFVRVMISIHFISVNV